MSRGVDVRQVERGDTVSLSQLSREAFPESLWDLMPNCQDGFDEYVRLGLSRPSLRWSRTFWVASVDGHPAGYAEWRDLAGISFLNHLCTSPSMRGLGVARSLMYAPFVRSAPAPIALDVFDDQPAITFYEHLGLWRTGRRCWHLRPVPDAPQPPRELLVSDGISHFESGLRTFGFSRLDASWDGRTVEISFPSPRLARLARAIDFADDSLLRAIKAAVPTVEQFAWIAEEDDAVDSRTVQWSSRFVGELQGDTTVRPGVEEDGA